MTSPIDIDAYRSEPDVSQVPNEHGKSKEPEGVPSNEVYARVGDEVLQAAQGGVRRGLRPEDIIREIVTTHHVRLSLGELRLLLASRRVPRK